MNSIVPLFPDVEDCNGRRVIIKLDMGSGRLNPKFLAKPQLLGFIVYPIVPNGTAVMQEAKQSFGYFKHLFTSNLKKMRMTMFIQNLPLSFGPSHIGLLVFGSHEDDTHAVYENDFDKAFSSEKNLWA